MSEHTHDETDEEREVRLASEERDAALRKEIDERNAKAAEDLERQSKEADERNANIHLHPGAQVDEDGRQPNEDEEAENYGPTPPLINDETEHNDDPDKKYDEALVE